MSGHKLSTTYMLLAMKGSTLCRPELMLRLQLTPNLKIIDSIIIECSVLQSKSDQISGDVSCNRNISSG